MKTIVYQSYKTSDVPAWIVACLRSVQHWAEACGFEYRCFDDGFLALAPSWFRDKAQGQICTVVDLARLVAAQQMLSAGYDRAIWVDADVLVFDPERLTIGTTEGFAFCHEAWLYQDAEGQRRVSHRANNALCVFCRVNNRLDDLIGACLQIGERSERLGKLDVGTRFLTQLHQEAPFPLITRVGMLSPALMGEICRGQAHNLVAYAQSLPEPLACANLCASLQGQNIQGVVAEAPLYHDTVQALLASRGQVINQHCRLPLAVE